jgi:hypothetical protein
MRFICRKMRSRLIPESLSLTVDPEPATITLLGIEGLILLRRKRKDT